jgi:hypothetical protein
MKSKSTMSILFKVAALFIMATIIFTNCKKAEDVAPIPAIPLPPDLTTKVTTSMVSGFVTDGNNAAVKDASVTIGGRILLTDKYGYFEARNVPMIQNAAIVSVSKVGFFKGIKTYIATANKGAFFRIKLMPKTSAGTVSGTTGGNVTLASGLGISFPASAIVNATTNAAYTGAVTVAAFYINPTSADLPLIMPGDLRGLNTDGNLQLLTTYGMVAVELTGAGGELLQIASGKKATITMPIPTAISTTAPASIPLWYFDEDKGLWKQEGSATKTGNNYVGDVSHFSFWNYDVPANYVQFNCTVVNTAGLPVQNAYVKISQVSNPLNAAYGHTDSSGYVSGAVPNNANLKIEVFANSSCGTVAFSQPFTTTNVNIAFGNVTINSTTSIATLVGSVKNCAGAPVTNGYIIILDGNIYNRYQLSNTGTYSFNKLVCTFPNQVSLVGEDITALQQNTPVSYNISAAGVNNIPAITACGVTTQQFINYTINGTSYGFTAPTDSVRFSNGTPNTNNLATINGFSNGNNTNVFMYMSSTGIALNSSQNLLFFDPSQINDSTNIVVPIFVNVTEYGSVGQFVSGNFNGALRGSPPANIIYNVTCNFRLRRYN